MGVRARAAIALLVVVLVCLPYFFVDFAPGTDLPQHMAQVRLLGETLSDPDGSPYQIQWFIPYALVYVPLSIAWKLFEPVTAVRVGAATITVFWVLAVHVLAARFERPLAAACLASVLVFNQTLYWGFLNFLFGFVAFVAYLLAHERRAGADESPVRASIPILVTSVLLYATHALWFAVAMFWTGISFVLHPSKRRLTTLAVGLTPSALLAAPTFFLLQSTAASPAEYFRPLTQRIDLKLFPEYLLGGLRHPIEIWVSLAVLLYVVVAIASNRGSLRARSSQKLLLLAGLLLLLYFALPSRYTRTIYFNTRFFAPGIVCLLLAIPRPRVDPRAALAFSLVVLVALVGVTTSQWVTAERVELEGLESALAALPPEPRVMGVNTIAQYSRYLDGVPYLQTFAYSQLLRGGRLSFSFADSNLSLVVYKGPSPAAQRRIEWLEWLPGYVRPEDFLGFDHALISGGDAVHLDYGSQPHLEPVTNTGVWRLYRVRPEKWPAGVATPPV